MLRFKYSTVFKIISLLVLLAETSNAENSHADPDSHPIERIGRDSLFRPLEPRAWGPDLGHIVLRSSGDYPTDLSSWSFGSVQLGYVFELQFQIRDSKGIVPVNFVRRDQTILMQLNARPGIEVPLAKIERLNRGDEGAGHGGENLHWELNFIIPDLSIVRENSRTFHEYSLLLPLPFERLAGCSRAIATVGDRVSR